MMRHLLPDGVTVLAAVVAAGAVGIAAVAVRPRPIRPLGSRGAGGFVPQVDRSLEELLHAATRRLAGSARRRTVQADAVADWCDDIARRSRSGSALPVAIAEADPADDAVRAATAHIRVALARGSTVADAVASMGPAKPGRGFEHVTLACSVIAVVARLGGPAGPPIDRVADALRLRSADEHERSAQSAQASLSAHVLTAVPLLMLAAMTVADADVRAAIGRPPGMGCVGAGMVLNVTGWWWMRREIRR